MPTFNEIEAEFESRLNQCWHSILVADVAQLGGAHGWRTVSRDVRAAATVFAMAELEALLKDAIEETHSNIEASAVDVGALRAGVRMLHMGTRFSAASGPEGYDTTWLARLEVGRSHQCEELVALPRRDPQGSLAPIGNRTPRARTISLIWTIYELTGDPFPQLSWRSSLGELASLRNDVAHRRSTLRLVMAGPDRTADSIAGHVRNVRYLGAHVVKALDDYCATQQYRC